jgi:pimeloyl-ACP methyl ester carboxylesterase
MKEHAIELSTGKLTYFQAGSGRPLLYLHPAGGVRRSKVLEGLAESFALYVPVIPGFEGTAIHPEVKSRQALARLAAEFIDRVIGSRCDVMGWSFGGCVALWLALERPQLVDHLVLECPAGLYSIDKRIKRVNRALLEHYGAEDGKDEALLARVAEVGHTTLILQGTDDGTIPEVERAAPEEQAAPRLPGVRVAGRARHRSRPAGTRARAGARLPRQVGLVHGQPG